MFSGTPLRLPIDVLPETTDGGRGLALLRHLDQSGGEFVLDRTKCVLPPPKSFAGFRVCKTGDFPREAGETALQSLPEFMYICPCQMDFHGVPPYIAVRSCRFPRRPARITSADCHPLDDRHRRPRPTHPYAPMQRYRHVLSNKKRARGGNPSASPGAVPDSLWIIEGLSTGSTGTREGWGRQGERAGMYDIGPAATKYPCIKMSSRFPVGVRKRTPTIFPSAGPGLLLQAVTADLAVQRPPAHLEAAGPLVPVPGPFFQRFQDHPPLHVAQGDPGRVAAGFLEKG